MLIQKIEISKNSEDSNINIFLESKYNLGGLSEDIGNLITNKSEGSINVGTDGENLRFLPLSGYALKVFFLTNNIYQTIVPIGDTSSDAFKNSFYIYQIFDTPFEDNQKLLYTGYLNGFNFNGIDSSQYSWASSFEYADIHIPNSFLTSQTGNTFYGYMKLFFYNASQGNVIPFDAAGITNTEADLYNKMTFTIPYINRNGSIDNYSGNARFLCSGHGLVVNDLIKINSNVSTYNGLFYVNFGNVDQLLIRRTPTGAYTAYVSNASITWSKVFPTYSVSPFIFNQINNSSYTDSINNSVDSLSIEKPTFPTGNQFTDHGTYLSI
jgi:hypothetical protein